MPKFKPSAGKNKETLKLSDCTCPICLEITVEPVDMPCKHEICLNCFDTMLDNKDNKCCPMCRLNIEAWSRNARRNNQLINIKRWKLIRESFPIEVKNRLEGKQTTLLNETFTQIKCARKGEIRKEYLALLKRVDTNVSSLQPSLEKFI